MDDASQPKCAVVVTDISGREWICNRQVHAKIYRRHFNGKSIFGSNPSADQHYFVVRYPYGTEGQST